MPILMEGSPSVHRYSSAELRDLAIELREAAQDLRDLLDCTRPDPTPVDDLTDTSVPWVDEPGPTGRDYEDYRDVLEGAPDGPSPEDWADYGQWVDGIRADRQEREYEEQELSEMGIRHGVIDCYA